MLTTVFSFWKKNQGSSSLMEYWNVARLCLGIRGFLHSLCSALGEPCLGKSEIVKCFSFDYFLPHFCIFSSSFSLDLQKERGHQTWTDHCVSLSSVGAFLAILCGTVSQLGRAAPHQLDKTVLINWIKQLMLKTLVCSLVLSHSTLKSFFECNTFGKLLRFMVYVVLWIISFLKS